MKMTNKKKILILAGMFALLVVTAVLNYVIAANAGKSGGDDVVAVGNYFTNFRTERKLMRDDEINRLDTIINNELADAASRAGAMEQKQKLINIMEQEVNLEYYILAGGYDDVVVSIGSVSGNVNVILKTDKELEQSQLANIYSIINDEMKVPGGPNIDHDLIRIIPI